MLEAAQEYCLLSGTIVISNISFPVSSVKYPSCLLLHVMLSMLFRKQRANLCQRQTNRNTQDTHTQIQIQIIAHPYIQTLGQIYKPGFGQAQIQTYKQTEDEDTGSMEWRIQICTPSCLNDPKRKCLRFFPSCIHANEML